MIRVSKLNQERWLRFKANKRGFISLSYRRGLLSHGCAS